MKTFIASTDVVEESAHSFTAEASELGWAPGVLPKSLETNLGNKLPLELIGADAHVFKYQQVGGCIRLHVFND